MIKADNVPNVFFMLITCCSCMYNSYEYYLLLEYASDSLRSFQNIPNQHQSEQAKPKAKSSVKTPSKKKVTVSSQVTKALKMDQRKSHLNFWEQMRFLMNYLRFKNRYQTLCMGDLQLPAIPRPNSCLQLSLLNYNQDQPSTPQQSE